MTGSLRALLEAGVAKAPDNVVISADGVELSWSRLHGQACRVAAALVRDGVKPQDRVIYLGKNDPRYFEVLFGCALAGAVLTPLNWRLAADELAAIIKDAQATIAFVDSSVVPAVKSGLKAIVALAPHESWQPYAQWCGPSEDPGVSPQSHRIPALYQRHHRTAEGRDVCQWHQSPCAARRHFGRVGIYS
jgi:acyl-CoA synthetase (AMP-forming)/AMP-acid ligase II